MRVRRPPTMASARDWFALSGTSMPPGATPECGAEYAHENFCFCTRRPQA